jgi:Flp pilus assembly pilin Flp
VNIRNQRGQGLIEYVILVALVGVATMGMVRLLQKNLRVSLANVIHALAPNHRTRREHFEHVQDRDLIKADFSNFMSNAAGTGHDSE